ncbi:MAG TPA: hypothetical protein VJ813_02470 [Vicinamibacterales bacterium]|nr:hypothetical protein [Vicinamibacterales bacterium]
MFRILRAFAWLRWRMLVNSLEKTGSRDALERFSIAIERLGPLLAAILLIPSALFLAGLGIGAGYLLATGGSAIPFTATRYLLFVVPLLAVVGPLFLPAADRTNPIRLLLLPIPGSVLYVAQASAALGDPWTMLAMPLLAGIPIGLAAGGALTGALICLVAGALLVVVVLGISALSTSVLHLVVRDRRRGELMALIFIVFIPLVAMLPGLLGSDGRRRRGEHREPRLPAWASEAGARALQLYPSEAFVTGTTAAAAGNAAGSGAALAALAASAMVLHGFGVLAFRRVLDSPGTTGARRSAPMRAAWGVRLPGLSTGASAVALAQLRLALRTPRGRAILLSPVAFFVIFGVMMYRNSGNMDFGPFRFGSGLGLATFASSMCLLSILPIAMNQFAVDKAGLTMALLSPLTDEELLAGKAAGNALITAPPMLVCILGALLLFPDGSPFLWATLVLGLISVHFLVAPVAAMCSASFPRAVDMNSIGRGSNAHGAAGFIGLVAFLVAAVPPALLTLLATRILERPSLAPVLLAIWCAIAYGVGRLLFIPARRFFAARRENLAMLV